MEMGMEMEMEMEVEMGEFLYMRSSGLEERGQGGRLLLSVEKRPVFVSEKT